MVLANFELYGRDSFQAYQTIAVMAQVGAVLGVIIKTRSQEIKKVGTSAGITGIFGITEPAIYGITLRFKKPFIYGCISGAVGAIAASFFNPYYFAYAGLPGPLTIVNGIDPEYPMSIWGILLGVGIAVILPIILIQLLGFGEDTAKQAGDNTLINEQGSSAQAAAAVNEDTRINEETVRAPFAGSVIPLDQVPDEVFSSGAMGKGVAIRPSGNKVYAPFNGTVVMTAPTKHAIGLRSDAGVELLIHVGLDTVNLEGKPFTVKVENDSTFEKGDLLLEFDKQSIEAEGLDTITPIIVTNSGDYEEIIFKDEADSTLDQELFTVIK